MTDRPDARSSDPGATLPADAPDGGARTEILYESDRTRVVRERRAGEAASVIRKEPAGYGWERRLRHELAILQRLTGIDGVPRTVGPQPSGNAIVFEDLAGTPARDHRLPMSPAEVVQVALGLARTLALIHGRGVVHRDISPDNVLLPPGDADGRGPVLIDYDLAGTFVEEHPDFAHPGEVLGTLAYMAPEQTGRTGRPVDQRTDLYGLGATLYTLATGRPPFGDNDPLRLIRDQLTRAPVPVARLDPSMPAALSDMIGRLLEKEPDRRYQSAAGLAYDLARLNEDLANGRDRTFVLGVRDFPAHLIPPSSLVGRAAEVSRLGAAFRDTIAGRGRGMLVTGPPGVGKSTLVDELRPMVTEAGGWFVAGKADQYRSDWSTDPVSQAMSALVRLLLVEPEERLAGVREDLRRAVGDNLPLMLAAVPAFGLLFGGDVEPVPAEDLVVDQARLFQAGMVFLGLLVSPERPLVLVLDDLQWADAVPLGFLDTLLTGPGIPGLFVVGCFREVEPEEGRPLTEMLARWERLGATPPAVGLGDLPGPELAVLVAGTLRLPLDQAGPLAEAAGERTHGNPYETVELLNALRRDGVLTLLDDGWRWDPDTVHRYVGSGDVADLLADRIEALPASCRDLLQVMACLGGPVTPDLLRHAAGVPAGQVTERLLPALEDGLVVVVGGGPAGDTLGVQAYAGGAGGAGPAGAGADGARTNGAGTNGAGTNVAGTNVAGADSAGTDGVVRFRHDRVQQAAYTRMALPERRRVHLALGRRLSHRARFRLPAAEQYLAAVELLHRPAECRRVARLFGRAAGGTWLTSPDLAERLLTAAVSLLEDRFPVRGATGGGTGDGTGGADGADGAGVAEAAGVARDATAASRLLATLDVQSHAVLCNLGRHDRADEVFARIRARTADPLGMVDPACSQIMSLSSRARQQDALAVGLDLMAELGLPRPDDLEAAVGAGLAALRGWAAEQDTTEEAQRPEATEPRVLGLAKLMRKLAIPAFFADPMLAVWMSVQGHVLWREWGPCSDLLSVQGTAGGVLARQEDYRSAYLLDRKLLALGETLGYADATARTRGDFSIFVQHWFDTLEETVDEAVAARESLVRAGDLHAAIYTYAATTKNILEIGPTLDRYTDDVEAALALGARTGNDTILVSWQQFRAFARCLRGEITPDEFDEATDPERVSTLRQGPRRPFVLASYHDCAGRLAALWGDAAALARHTAAGMNLMPFHRGFSISAVLYLLRALSLSLQVRHARPSERPRLLTELDSCCGWLAARAADAAANYADLARWAEAEREWANGDFTSAALAFDQAQSAAAASRRPWRQALINERAGRFHLEHGLDHLGLAFLARARRGYEAWGATGKVTALEREFPGLVVGLPPGDTEAVDAARGRSRGASGGLTSDTIDLMGVLRASQALSSETSLDRLTGRVTEVLGALTGASSVRLLVWGADRRGWFLPAGQEGVAAALPVVEAGERGLVPVSAVRYVERSGEPLLVEDAVEDGRFARDGFLAGVRQCSLLVVPIAVHGEPRAMLVLENRLNRGAFSTGRLDVVMLIAGQLAVSLENALVYASLEQRVAERTEALEAANEQLEMMTVTDPLTGLANRRRLAQVLDLEWRRAASVDRPVALAMIDIDHFKAYNDRYGHLAGDTCLRTVAAALAGNVRDRDLVARYGGEEFAIVLPGADTDAARAVAERLRAAVENLREPHAGAPEGVLTVSIGVAAGISTLRQPPRALIEAADVQLYRAKREGRNRVAAAGLTPPA